MRLLYIFRDREVIETFDEELHQKTWQIIVKMHDVRNAMFVRHKPNND